MSSDTLTWYFLRKPHIHTTMCFQGSLIWISCSICQGHILQPTLIQPRVFKALFFEPDVRFAKDTFYRVMSENKADIGGNRIVEFRMLQDT